MIRRDPFYFRVFCITFWVLATIYFVAEELLPFTFPTGTITLIGDFVFLILGLVTLKSKWDKNFILAFFVFAIIVSLLNNIPFILIINGARDYIGLFFTYIILKYFFTCNESYRYRQSIDKQLLIFLILQSFCVTVQFLRYGAGDEGGGSLGHYNSGNISILIISLSFYFVIKNWDSSNYLRSLWQNRWYILLIFPVFLNETKASFVLILIYFVLLFGLSWKSTGKILIAIPVLILLVIGMQAAYNWVLDRNDEIASNDFIDDYLTGGEDIDEILDYFEYLTDNELGINDFSREVLSGYDLPDAPRIFKIAIMPDAMMETPGGIWFGAGLGHTKGGTSLERTQFMSDHWVIYYGTVLMAHVWFLAIGIIGLIFIIVWFKKVLAFKRRYGRMPLEMKIFLTILILFTFFYNVFFIHLCDTTIFYYLCLTTCYPLIKKDHEKLPASRFNYSSGL